MNGILGVVPEGYYTRSQTAAMIERSVSALRQMERDGDATPSAVMRCGKTDVHLYSIHDVKAARRALRHRRPGPKPKDPNDKEK